MKQTTEKCESCGKERKARDPLPEGLVAGFDCSDPCEHCGAPWSLNMNWQPQTDMVRAFERYPVELNIEERLTIRKRLAHKWDVEVAEPETKGFTPDWWL